MNTFESQTQAPPKSSHDEITIGKTTIAGDNGKATEIFKMTLGGETIELLPLRNWGQLDVFKWTVRGKLPGTPSGLDITFDHVKIAGEVVSTSDPEGPEKLQKSFNQWLAFERGTLELARKKAHHSQAAAKPQHLSPEKSVPHFRVEVDKEGQVHIICLQGKETLAKIGLSIPGFNSLFNQGLMHKPHSLKAGALHNWVEIDGELFSFENGNNDASRLEKVLNERYLATTTLGQGKDVAVFTNAASSTGFDIQFTAKVGGVPDNRRRPLNEDTLELLQDPDKCGLLPKDIVLKLSRPNLIFKRKTPDGGERYLDKSPENTAVVVDDDGQTRTIDLSQPVNYLRLTAVELTAVFNCPTVNQHSKTSPQTRASLVEGNSSLAVHPAPQPPLQAPRESEPPAPAMRLVEAGESAPEPSKPEKAESPVLDPAVSATQIESVAAEKPSPNLWLEPMLARPSIRHDWFVCLVYSKIAEYFGNSQGGQFGLSPCWAISLGEVDDVADPAFKGVFLTQKSGLAYLNQGHIARFQKEVAVIGRLDSAIEGIGVSLVAVGTDLEQRMVFVVTEGYRSRFGIPESTVTQELERLKQHGAMVMSANEVLRSPEPLQVVWTVPVEQESPGDPQAVESIRDDSAAAEQAKPEVLA